MVNKIIEKITDPYSLISSLGVRGLFNWMSDEKYLKMLWRLKFHKSLNLDNPQTFNEKLQWLKIHDRKPIYTTMADKYAVKKYVADKIGGKYIIPTLGVWESFEDINFDILPNQFVLKCTHDSGGIIIVKDKNNFDKKSARKLLERNLIRNFYYCGREWPYKNFLRESLRKNIWRIHRIRNLGIINLTALTAKFMLCFWLQIDMAKGKCISITSIRNFLI